MRKRTKAGELNEKEKRVLASFPENGEPITLLELAKVTFRKKGIRPTARGNSWVRNCMRKLTKQAKVKQVGRGTYALKVSVPF